MQQHQPPENPRPTTATPSYSPMVYCFNCGLHRTMEIPKGKTIQKTLCPNCGCETLGRRQFVSAKEAGLCSDG